MKKNLHIGSILIIIMAANVFNVHSQIKTNSFSAEYLQLQIKEANITTLLSTSPGLALKYNRDIAKLNRIYSFTFDLATSMPKTRIESKNNSLYANVKLSFAYLKLLRAKTRGRLYGGGTFSTDYRTAYYNNFDQSRFYWNSFIGIDGHLKYNQPISSKFEVLSSLKMPLLGLVSRPRTVRFKKADDSSPAYILKKIHSDLQVALPIRHLNPSFELGSKYNITERHSATMFYNFAYLSSKTSYSESYQEIRHSLGLKYTF